MKLPDHTFQGKWTPLEIDGQELGVEEYIDNYHSIDRVSPTKTVYLMRPEDRAVVRGNPVSPDVTRFSYFAQGNVGVLTGVWVGSGLLGRHLGKKVLNYAEEQLKQRDIDLKRTGNVNKPILALLLQREGWQPVRDDYIVEILRPRQDDDQRVPSVRVLWDRARPGTVRRESSHGEFYRVLDTSQVGTAEIDYKRAVRLHTPYLKIPANNNGHHPKKRT